MTTSKTFEQAEKFFNENKDALLDIMFNELKEGVSIDHQEEFDQVVLCGNGFHLCCQNSDMNGDSRGEAHYTNDGADGGFNELCALLIRDYRSSQLYASEEFWSKEYVREMAYLIADKLVEHFKVESMFLCDNED